MCPIFAQIAGRTLFRLVSVGTMRLALGASLSAPPPTATVQGLIDMLSEQFVPAALSPNQVPAAAAQPQQLQAPIPDCTGPGIGWG